MAILVLATDVLPWLKLAADDSYNNVATTHNAVEAFVKTYCNRNFEAVDYYEEHKDFRNGEVALKNRPLNYVKRASVSTTTVMRVSNSNTYAVASVNVSSTALVLDYNGASSTVTFAANTTIGAMVTAVNALGNGWSASLEDADMTSIPSTELLKQFGGDALGGVEVELYILGGGVAVDVINPDNGIVMPHYVIDDEYYNSVGYSNTYYGYPRRTRQLFRIRYNAGYSSATLPKDLKVAMLNLISYWYAKNKDSATGVDSFSISDYSITYQGTGGRYGTSVDVPVEVSAVFDKYREVSL